MNLKDCSMTAWRRCYGIWFLCVRLHKFCFQEDYIVYFVVGFCCSCRCVCYVVCRGQHFNELGSWFFSGNRRCTEPKLNVKSVSDCTFHFSTSLCISTSREHASSFFFASSGSLLLFLMLLLWSSLGVLTQSIFLMWKESIVWWLCRGSLKKSRKRTLKSCFVSSVSSSYDWTEALLSCVYGFSDQGFQSVVNYSCYEL